jgi:hypothetical protein
MPVEQGCGGDDPYRVLRHMQSGPIGRVHPS